MGIGLRRHPHLRLAKEDGPDCAVLGGYTRACSTCTHNEFRVEDVFTDWIDTNTK